jgi:hypothetical protein
MSGASPRPRPKIAGAALLAAALAVAGGPAAPAHAQGPQSGSVLTYHQQPDRGGNFVMPALGWDAARRLHLDPSFHAEVSGHVYAQPLYWREPGAANGVLIVATENDTVHALDAATGRALWQRKLGEPAPRTALPCGNIDPLGITGTPVIEDGRGALYLDAVVMQGRAPHHLVFGLSLRDGGTLPGWPVDIGAALGRRFDARVQNERGALALLGGTLDVPFGGHFGDCGDYRGWVVGIALDDPRRIASWSTRGKGGGIWAPGGISSDAQSLFVATGNTLDATQWQEGEGVFRLAPDLHHSDRPQDFFAPSDWRALDDRDADLGGTNPLPLDVPAAGGARRFVLALGKDRRAYLLDRDNLGGIGGALIAETVAAGAIRTAPAAYPTADGMFVAFQGRGAQCPQGSGSGLTVLKIAAAPSPRLATAWCGAVRGAGSPIVTTTDGRNEPIVWILGAEGDDRLHGFRGDTGQELFSGGGPSEQMRGLRHFQTLIAAGDRLYVAADSRVYALAWQ